MSKELFLIECRRPDGLTYWRAGKKIPHDSLVRLVETVLIINLETDPPKIGVLKSRTGRYGDIEVEDSVC